MFSFALAVVTRGLSLPTSRLFSSSAVTSFPKLKSHSGAKKRWRGMPNGRFKREKAYHQHLNMAKSPNRRNKLGKTVLSNQVQTPRLKKLLPYA